MTPPPLGPLNTSGMDDTTDAYDTIDWLVKNVPESNGKVGMLGSSYEGFTVVMALIHPHPALKVAAPESPMVDGWMGDDWFHYGAFRQPNLDYFTEQTTARGKGAEHPARRLRRLHQFSAGRVRPAISRATAAWTNFRSGARWKSIPPTMPSGKARRSTRSWRRSPLKVPTMWLQGLWDQEDMWGAIHSYEAVEPKDTGQRQELSGDGPVAAQPGELRRLSRSGRCCGMATPRCSSAAMCCSHSSINICWTTLPRPIPRRS